MQLFAARCTVPIALVALLSASASAQTQTPKAQPGGAADAPTVGQMAPDFTLPGTTRYGPLATPVHLSDFHGQTVVLAFFPKARTKG
jgi:thioredoxin-dependent peroxiredoxin